MTHSLFGYLNVRLRGGWLRRQAGEARGRMPAHTIAGSPVVSMVLLLTMIFVATIALAETQEDLARAIEQAARKPRHPSADSAADPSATYVSEWIKDAEKAGGGNRIRSTTDAGGNGDVLLAVSIARDGSVHETVVRKSSGDARIDAAVVRLIRSAAPFRPLPPGIGDELYVTRTWHPLTGLVLSENIAGSNTVGAKNAVQIRADWAQNFKDSLKFKRTSATKYPGGRRDARELRAVIDVAVRKRDDAATILAWTYTHMTLNGRPMADLALEVSVAGDGAVALENTVALERQVRHALTTNVSSGAPEMLGKDQLSRMAGNKDLLSAFYLRDAMIFFQPMGVTVRRDQAMEIDGLVPGLDEAPLKVVDRWTVLPPGDIPAGTLALEWAQTFDRRDVERYYTQLIHRLGMRVDVTHGSITKKGLYALDATTFWPHVVLNSSKVVLKDDYEQYDVVEIRSSQLDPDWKH